MRKFYCARKTTGWQVNLLHSEDWNNYLNKEIKKTISERRQRRSRSPWHKFDGLSVDEFMVEIINESVDCSVWSEKDNRWLMVKMVTMKVVIWWAECGEICMDGAYGKIQEVNSKRRMLHIKGAVSDFQRERYRWSRQIDGDNTSDEQRTSLEDKQIAR